MKKDTLEGRARSKNGVKRLCFSAFCILLEAAFIVMMITKLNEYAEIVNLITRLFAGVLVLALYASDKTSSMKMPWVILILIFPIMGVALYLLIGLNGGTRKMRQISDTWNFRVSRNWASLFGRLRGTKVMPSSSTATRLALEELP